MATSFLQYCAMCEKQITHPCSSILYCSESCRRKDSNKPLSAASLPSVTTRLDTPPPLQSRTSTRWSISLPPTTMSSVRIPQDSHTVCSNIDPTEWKPKLAGQGNRRESEAFRYLTKFHRKSSSDTDEFQETFRVRSHDSYKSLSTTPSLGNTPTTSDSSLYDSMGGYDFSTRPLQSRQNPEFSASSAAKGIDLVTPHIAPLFAVAVSSPEETDRQIWKRRVVPGVTSGTDGLASLLRVAK